MVHICTPPALILCLVLPLGGCGDIVGALEFADARDDFQSRRDALSARSNTAFTAVPDEGTPTYTGEASLAAGTRADGVILLGDASLTLDFENDTVTGILNNFGGFDATEEYSDYTGSLVFQGGVLGVDRPNDLESQIVGTLVGEDYTINVDAAWEGDLKGTPIGGVLGDTTAADSLFELNGTEVPGGIIIAVQP